ncbi:MAG: DEAD/DEAH box helicase [Zetaproteobacteria bacterium]|nr:DEAD/DEAH box helicase [Zetaproteobacteria bacterium]
MKAFLALLRDGADTSTWSKGVGLAREHCVQKKQSVYHVTDPKNCVTYQAELHLQEEDWNCSCHSDEDPCAHVIASAIAEHHQKFATTESTPQSDRLFTNIEYRFHHSQHGVWLERYWRDHEGTKTQQILGSIGSYTSGRKKLPFPGTISVDQADWEVDQLLKNTTTAQETPLDPLTLSKAIPLLSQTSHLSWQGRAVQLHEERKFECLKIRDYGPGIIIQIVPHPQLEQEICDGACWMGGKLTGYRKLPPKSVGLSPASLHSKGQHLGREDALSYISKWLKKIREYTEVDYAGKNLPQLYTVAVRPGIYVEMLHGEKSFRLTPCITYGNPAIARVHNNRLIPLHQRIPHRNTRAEENIPKRWNNLFPNWPFKEPRDFSTREILQHRHDFFRPQMVLLGSGLSSIESLRHPTELQDPQLIFHENGCRLAGKASSSSALTTCEFELTESLQGWDATRGLLSMPNGKWAKLPAIWLERYRPILEEMLERKPNASTRKALQYTYALQENTLDKQTRTTFTLNGYDNYSPQVPQQLQAKLRPYQKEGVLWLQKLQHFQLGGLLADDMGLGKTLQACSTLTHQSLVVVPRSLIQNWAHEIEKFRPDLNTYIYHGHTRNLETFQKIPNAVLLTSYQTLRADIQHFSDQAFAAVILDEAQTIKNRTSLVHQAVLQLQAKFKLALTGTPVENSPEDLVNIFRFIIPGLHLTSPITQSGAPKEELNSMRRKIEPFILRRTKDKVAQDLPEKIEQNILCELSEKEQHLYAALSLSTQQQIYQSQGQAGQMKIFELLLRLRQAACHPRLLPGSFTANGHTSTKIEILLDMLQANLAHGQKSLIFSQWTTFLDLIGTQLQERNILYRRIDGSTKDRGNEVDQFQSDPQVSCMLLSLKAAGTGLNLTAAENVYIMDPWWNPAAENQAADRAHRIGQDKTVMVTRFIAKGTVEEKMVQLAEQKRYLASALTNNTAEAAKLNKEDLLSVLSDMG